MIRNFLNTLNQPEIQSQIVENYNFELSSNHSRRILVTGKINPVSSLFIIVRFVEHEVFYYADIFFTISYIKKGIDTKQPSFPFNNLQHEINNEPMAILKKEITISTANHNRTKTSQHKWL